MVKVVVLLMVPPFGCLFAIDACATWEKLCTLCLFPLSHLWPFSINIDLVGEPRCCVQNNKFEKLDGKQKNGMSKKFCIHELFLKVCKWNSAVYRMVINQSVKKVKPPATVFYRDFFCEHAQFMSGIFLWHPANSLWIFAFRLGMGVG